MTGTFEPGAASVAFVLSVVGGIGIGVGIGWGGHQLIASVDEHLTEMTVSVATAYGAFLAADTLTPLGGAGHDCGGGDVGLPGAPAGVDL